MRSAARNQQTVTPSTAEHLKPSHPTSSAISRARRKSLASCSSSTVRFRPSRAPTLSLVQATDARPSNVVSPAAPGRRSALGPQPMAEVRRRGREAGVPRLRDGREHRGALHVHRWPHESRRGARADATAGEVRPIDPSGHGHVRPLEPDHRTELRVQVQHSAPERQAGRGGKAAPQAQPQLEPHRRPILRSISLNPMIPQLA